MSSPDTDLVGQIGELRMTIEITRAATGKTETHELVGFTDPAKLEQFLAQKDERNGEA